MTTAPREAPRRRAAGRPPVWLVRLALAGALAAVAACGRGDTRAPGRGRAADTLLPDARRTGERGPAARPVVDSGPSLVVPVHGDSLIGAARGAGGEATLRAECAGCHPAAHDVRLPSATCSEGCHETVHEPVQAFYAGAVHGAPIGPDTMFVARVGCVDCHTDSTFRAPDGPRRQARLDRMCTECHGARFAGMLARWDDGASWRAQAVAAYVGQASADARLASGPAATPVRTAREALAVVRAGGALHNILGADRLLRMAADSTAAAYRRAGVPGPARPALGPDPERVACLACHYGVETARGTVFGETFDHASHVVRADVACSSCHSEAMYFRDAKRAERGVERDIDPRHGKTTLTAASCDNCHHPVRPTVACATCHADDRKLGQPIRVAMALDLRPRNATTTSRQVAFSHGEHAKTECASCHATAGAVRTVATCASCHQEHHAERAGGCTSCHGTEVRARHTRDDHLRCASCHARETVARLLPDRTVCLTCHARQADHQPGRECSTCHLQSTPPDLRRRILAESR